MVSSKGSIKSPSCPSACRGHKTLQAHLRKSTTPDMSTSSRDWPSLLTLVYSHIHIHVYTLKLERLGLAILGCHDRTLMVP